MKHRIAIASLSLASLFVFTACSPSGSGDQAATPPEDNAADPTNAPQPTDYLLPEQPEGAVSVAQARQSAQPGEPIVVTGQIGAALEPFGQNFATLILGDEALMYCDEMGDDDHCATPWDACCEDPDKVATHRASVQLVAQGAPLRGSLRGVGGLQELDRITVQGTVHPASSPDNLLINASGIYRHAEQP